MKRRGEIGFRPVAIRALAKLTLVNLKTPAIEIPAMLLELQWIVVSQGSAPVGSNAFQSPRLAACSVIPRVPPKGFRVKQPGQI
jgi:hypothetical protein